ncbi:MAG: M28 family peptidase, partial [Crocinitomicaceae bacterium]
MTINKFSFFLSALVWFQLTNLLSQTNIQFTNLSSEQIIKGNFNPADYFSSSPINQHADVVSFIQNNVSADSLKSYILKLASFENRNTASDTVSTSSGIGAARRWAFQKFSNFSAQAENRLIPSYFQFDRTICNVTQHRNVIAVLPGTDTTNHEVIVIEGHMDSRCENECDITCQAQGIEDNASGSALVLELARVMS